MPITLNFQSVVGRGLLKVHCLVLLMAVCAGLRAGAAQDRRLTVADRPGEHRVALVVGNDAYTDAPLRNARNDARSMARALEGLGFEVTLVENATRQTLTGAMATFGDRLEPNDVALFYYAGHGVQVDSENYLLPTDFRGTSASEVRLNAIEASKVQQLLRPARIAMLILDACRNNPFTGARGGSGLAAMEARGSLIAFATGAGQTAADLGNGANGLFTQELVKALGLPGLSVQEVFRRVRQSVYDASAGRQFPAVYDGLLGEFAFRQGPAIATATAITSSDNLAIRTELALWDAIKDSRSQSAFEDYLRQFPEGRFKVAAEERIAALRTPPQISPQPVSAPVTGVGTGATASRSDATTLHERTASYAEMDSDGKLYFGHGLPGSKDRVIRIGNQSAPGIVSGMITSDVIHFDITVANESLHESVTIAFRVEPPGRYEMQLEPGIYTLTFRCTSGYSFRCSESRKRVQVTSGSRATLNVEIKTKH